MTAPSQELLVEQRGPALWLTLNRPAAFNSLTPAIIAAANAALDRAEAEPGILCVVLTGAGKAFCAGADLKAALAGFSEADQASGSKRFIATALALTQRLERLPMPVIAAVNGIALAGGLELILSCDLVFAVESARLGDAHANYGLLPGAGSSVRLPARIGVNRANYLMFTGESLPASVLRDWGLVNEVVPQDGLADAVAAFVAKIAAKSPLGLARMKLLVRASADQSSDVALQAEQVMSELHYLSSDRLEGVRAFAEKRAPVFTGR